MTEKIKIVICGAGITGICLAHGLLKYPQFEVRCYEASTNFRGDGAAIGLGGNAQKGLQLINPQLREALDKAGGTIMDPSLRIMIATGTDSGKHVADVDAKIPKINVHRGHFLAELLKTIPEDTVVTGKKLTGLHKTVDGATLNFEDGSSETADAVVACDGINSQARQFVLSDDPSAKPMYTGGYAHRVVVPLETARAAFGDDYCASVTQYGWVGDGGFLLTDHVDGATAMQVVAGWITEEIWPHEAPFVPWPKERIQKDLEGWGEVGRAMTKIFTEQPRLFAAGGRMHPFTPSYSKENVCLAGDAAQSFSPFQGAGAGQAIEDALILETVLGAVKSRQDVAHAFSVYEKIRLPRRSSIADSSRESAILFTGRSDTGLNTEEMRKKLVGWGSNIVDYDIEAAQVEALQLVSRH